MVELGRIGTEEFPRSPRSASAPRSTTSGTRRRAEWIFVAHEKPLHIRQPGRSTLAQPLDRWSKSAAFIWYSGNTITNRAGSLMLYLSGAEGYAWYASFTRDEHWKVDDGRGITRRELKAFEESGRRLERVHA